MSDKINPICLSKINLTGSENYKCYVSSFGILFLENFILFLALS